MELRRVRRTVRLCTVAMIVLAVVLVALLWAVVGLAMRAGFVPFVDIGYRWFDAGVTSFFGFS